MDVSACCSFKLISVFFLFYLRSFANFCLSIFQSSYSPQIPFILYVLPIKHRVCRDCFFPSFFPQLFAGKHRVYTVLLSFIFPSVFCPSNIGSPQCFCPNVFPQYCLSNIRFVQCLCPCFCLLFCLSIIIIYCTCLPVRLHVCTVLLSWPVSPLLSILHACLLF